MNIYCIMYMGITYGGMKMDSVVGMVLGQFSTSMIVDVCAPSASVDTCSVAINFLYVC